MTKILHNLDIPHYEADIVTIEHAGKLAVKKTYRSKEPCIIWLNQMLQNFYPNSKIMPVAQHEYEILLQMSKLGISPKPLKLGKNYLVIEWGGTVLRNNAGAIPRRSYQTQTTEILKQWQQQEFCHNDLTPDNVLWNGEKIQIIDFTLAEYGHVRFIDQLPNPNWARVGKDSEIYNYLSLRWRFRYQAEAWQKEFNRLKSNLKKMLLSPSRH